MSDVGNVKIARFAELCPPNVARKPTQTLASTQTTGEIPSISSHFGANFSPSSLGPRGQAALVAYRAALASDAAKRASGKLGGSTTRRHQCARAGVYSALLLAGQLGLVALVLHSPSPLISPTDLSPPSHQHC
jgi:hypothetical protein